jgi:tetratricopeptide (TPR) repeat protein
MDAFQEASGASIPRPEAEGVFAAIAGTLEDLNPDDGLALAGLAYIADSPVPDPLAAALTGLDSESLTDLLSRCNRQSILSWSDGQVSVHALTVAALAATSQEDSLDVVRVRANIRLAQVNTDDLVALRAELVHYEAIHSQKLGRLGPDEEWLPSFGDDLATGYFALGRTDDAISLWERTLDLSEPVLGPEHPDTLTSRSNLANGYHAAGRTDDAIRLNEPTLEMRERVLGPEHPDTLRSNNNLAIAYFAAGRTDDAIRLGKQTFETMERVLGPEHPSTRTSRNNLAIGYRATGRIQDAERLESRE